jgi:hypothetical protein
MAKSVLLPAQPGFVPARVGLAKGARLYIDPAHSFRYLYGIYEMELRDAIKRAVYPGAKCFDVGGGWGYYAAVLWRLSGGPVVAFEPSEPRGRVIRELAEVNRADIKLVPLKVGSQVCEGFTTLDRAVEEFFVPGIVKMDIEGGELDALQGASALIARGTTTFVIEVHAPELERDCLRLLETAGYACKVIDRWRFGEDLYRRSFNRWLVALPPK